MADNHHQLVQDANIDLANFVKAIEVNPNDICLVIAASKIVDTKINPLTDHIRDDHKEKLASLQAASDKEDTMSPKEKHALRDEALDFISKIMVEIGVNQKNLDQYIVSHVKILDYNCKQLMEKCGVTGVFDLEGVDSFTANRTSKISHDDNNTKIQCFIKNDNTYGYQSFDPVTQILGEEQILGKTNPDLKDEL